MKYSILDFQKEFPNDDVCLDYIFHKKYGEQKYYRIDGRKGYANAEGKQIYPLKGTIFEKSDTSLVKWFYAIYLFSVSKNGVSGKELERQLKVTYKTGWRIAKQVRQLMTQGDDKLSGVIEADETYIGGYKKSGMGGKGKTPVIGLVERGGAVKAKVSARETHLILNHMKENVKKGSAIMSDQFGVYAKAPKFGFTHSSVNHWKKEFAKDGGVHTNTIEGFWSQLKRSIRGTYHSVSPKHLQSYVNEFAFRYSHRASPIFEAMMGKI